MTAPLPEAELCGAVWPDRAWDDGLPHTCHLPVEGHNPYYHAWFHSLHVGRGERHGDARVAWPTALGVAVMGDEDWTPRAVPVHHEADAFHTEHHTAHEVVKHPKHLMLRANLPQPPERHQGHGLGRGRPQPKPRRM